MLTHIHEANEVNNIMGTFYKVISILCLGYILSQVSALRTSFDDLQGSVSDLQFQLKELQEEVDEVKNCVDDIQYRFNIY
ncbi:MAG: hypothetical protein ACXWL2_01880 [Candidatus Chromulinivorax sp.]